jgi:uncharacterized protein (DUF58 family)
MVCRRRAAIRPWGWSRQGISILSAPLAKVSMSFALRVVLFLLFASLLAGAITGSQLYFRLSYVWLLLLAISWGMSWLALRNVNVHRQARSTRSQVGQVFEEHFEIQNPGRLPRLWIDVHDESSLPGSRGSHVLTLIGGRESRTYLARTRLQERGVFQLGPTRLRSGDLFGMFPVQRTFPSDASILVYPPIFEILSFPNPPGLLPGGEALRRRTQQITSNAAGVRDYVSGDPLNRIHWVSTARRGRLIVKEFELDPLAEVWIFIDANQGVHFSKPYQKPEYDPQEFWRKRKKYELPPVSEEYAVSIAASLARYYLQRGRSVGLVAFGQALQVLPADRGGRQLGKLLESLALLRATGGLPLEGMVEVQARDLPRGSTAILVTTSAAQNVFQTADVLLRRALRPVVVVLDSKSFGGPYGSEQIVASLQFLGIPVCKVACGDDLSQTLSPTVSLPQIT